MESSARYLKNPAHYRARAYRHDDGVKTVQDVIQVARAPVHLNEYPGPQNLYEIAGVPGEAESAARVKSDV